MYGPAHLFVLLTVTWLLLGTLQHPHRGRRYLGLACLAAMLLSHTITFLIVPPLALLLVIFTLTYRRDWLKQPRLWQDVIFAVIVLGTVLLLLPRGKREYQPLQDPW
jgi:hypothetical protein